MRSISIIFILFWCTATFGQEYQMDGNLLLINDCGGFLTDSGGSFDNYDAGQNFFTTICKDPREGTHIRLTFSQIDIAPGDRLCFYDGLSTSADSLVCVQSFHNGFPFIVQATAANESGCLTINFQSKSNSPTAEGWEANIDCIPSCQLIQAFIESTTPSAKPDTQGWIDICAGDRVYFDGKALFPQNNLIYEHSELNSAFEWDFGDGTFAVGKNVSHIFDKPGGYRVTLSVTDPFDCSNGNFAFQRVRVATKPTFIIGELPALVCIGDSIRLSGGISGDDTISTVETVNQTGSFLFTGVRSDSLALPDGNGASYKTSIRFTDFSAGQVLTNINDLRSICVNMEHSWLHDMEISITCPNGNTVLLQSQEIINKEVYLGIPEDNDGINPKAGIGLNYCWTPFSTNGTITEFANKNDNTGPNDTYYLPTENFESFESLESLLGCPLNGDWIITVTDLWEQDNGWIFSWSIDIDPDLYPDLETFETKIINYGWQNHPDIISNISNTIVALPSKAGTTNYVFEASDDYGCQHDTAIQITVLPLNHPDCLDCGDRLFKEDSTTICKGDLINLETFIDPHALGVVSKEVYPNQEFSFSTNPPTNVYRNPMQISNISDPKIKSDGSNLISVCVDISSDYNADLAITLISPNGIHLNLSSENGDKNDGYLNTCFTMTAERSITESSTTPFSGDYLPEEPFSKLANTDINGVWTIQLSDDAGTAASDINVLNSWSLTFLSPDGAIYNWMPTDNLSCSDCTDPDVSPDQSITYVLEKNLQGCLLYDSLHIRVIGNDIIQNIQNHSLADGNLLVNWQTLPGVSNYEVSRNSIDWMPAIGNYYHIFEGFTQGETLNVYVRGIYDDYTCKTAFRSHEATYKFCDVSAEISSNNLITSCLDSNDGYVVIQTSGGDGNYSFSLNNSLSQINNRFDNLGTGNYDLLVEDNQLCADTLNFSVTSPPELKLSFGKKDLACFGDDNGSATVFPSGGVGGYQVVAWGHTNSLAITINNLTSGQYHVTIADANNCLINDTIEIFEPPELKASLSASPVVCNGEGNGIASVKVTAGTPPYSFNWNNGQTGKSAINLNPGAYTVTISDANNCQAERFVIVFEYPELAVNFIESPVSCMGGTDAALLAEVNGGNPPYRYEWNTGQSNQFAFGLKADRYKFTVTDSRGCEKEEIIFIDEPNPLVLSTSFTPTLCALQNNGTASVNVVGGAPPYTYKWSDSTTQTTATAINLGAKDYLVTVTDNNGCEAIQNVRVSSANPISINFEIREASCSNRSDGSVIAKVTGGSGNYAYHWENGINNAVNSNLLPGKYSITVIDDNACQTVDTAEIISPFPLKIDSISHTIPLCPGAANGILEAFISGGIAPYEYNWNNNGGTANPFTGAQAGTHTLSLFDANGCVAFPVTVNLPDAPVIDVNIIQQDVKCFNGNDGSASVIANGGHPPLNYLWNDANLQTSATVNNLIAGTYQVNIKDNNGCIEQTEVIIEQPNATISTEIIQTDTSCFKENQNHASISVSGGTGATYTYEWSSGNMTNSVADLEASKYFISVYDENNCQKVDSIIIKELDSIAFSILEVKPSCADTEDGQLALSPIQGGFGNGISTNYLINWSTNPNTNQALVSNLKGNTSYKVTVTDQIGCSEELERFLKAPIPISASLSSKNISCFGENDGVLTLNEFNSSANIQTFGWSNNVPVGTTDTASNLSKGNYSLKITDTNGCSITLEETIQEPNALSIKNQQIVPNICSQSKEGQIFLEIEGGLGNYTFNWSDGSQSQNLNNAVSGNYRVSIQDEKGCVLIDSFELVGPSTLDATIQVNPVSCQDEANGSLEINTFGGTPPYAFSLDGESYNGIQKIIGLEAGIYKVFVKDNLNCIYESPFLEIVSPAPFNVKINSNTNTIELGDSIQLNLQFSNNSGPVQYDWSSLSPNSFECNRGLCSSIYVSPIASTTYEIYAVDELGCEASDLINIFVTKPKKIFVPSGFTPNGDGTNDFLQIHGQEGINLLSFSIFDRWGEEIFYSNEMKINNLKNTWDGTFKGETLNTGVFVWILEVRYPDGEIEILKGNTTLIR